MSFDFKRIETIANELIEKHNLLKETGIKWTFKWINSTSSIGVCHYRSSTIRLSKVWALYLPEWKIIDTILHEIAHALTPGDYHGSLWKKTCLKVGALPERLAKIDLEIIMKVELHKKYLILFIKDDGSHEVISGRDRLNKPLLGIGITGRPETKGKLHYIETKHYGKENLRAYTFKIPKNYVE